LLSLISDFSFQSEEMLPHPHDADRQQMGMRFDSNQLCVSVLAARFAFFLCVLIFVAEMRFCCVVAIANL